MLLIARCNIIYTKSGFQRSNTIPCCRKNEARLSVIAVGAREAAGFPEITLSVLAMGATEAAEFPEITFSVLAEILLQPLKPKSWLIHFYSVRRCSYIQEGYTATETETSSECQRS